jgi:hypothetical protein
VDSVGKVEWFDAKEKGKVIDSQLIMVPDEYGRSLQLTNILKRLQEQLEQQTVVAQYVFSSVISPHVHLFTFHHSEPTQIRSL